MIEKLQTGDTFPDVRIQLVGGGEVSLPGDLDSKFDSEFGVALFFRGHW